MNSTFFSLFFLSTITIFSQPIIDWQKTYGGSGNDVLSKIVLSQDGYIIGGFSNSNTSGEKNQNSRGLLDYWLLSLNQSGQIVWQRTLGGSLDDSLNAMCYTNDGGVIVGGVSYSNISGEKSQNSRGSGDYWILKLDVNGVIEWQKTIGGGNLDVLRSINQTSDGGFILGGTSNSDISGEKNDSSRGLSPSNDYWVIKTDAFGIIEWQKTIGGDGSDELACIKQTSDNGYILVGTSTSDANYDKTENSRGLYDYWIVRLDSSGLIEWQKTYGGSQEDYAQDVLASTDNGYYVGGFSYSGISGDKVETLRGVTDFWILKLDFFGAIVWQKTIGGSGADFLYSMLECSDNSVLLSGSSESSISGDKTEDSRGLSDMWLVKLNQSGSMIWQKTIGGSNVDNIFSIKKTSNDSYLLGGNSRSSISGEKSDNSRGETDYWLVKLSSDNLSTIENELKTIEVYPNPTRGSLSIFVDKSIEIDTLLLTDGSGKIIICHKNQSNKIDIEGESGIYLLKITTTTGIQKSFKILKF